MVSTPTGPPPKLRVILRALALRAARPEAFAGSYEPVRAGGDAVAFLRGDDVFVAARLRGAGPLPRPEGEWRDELGLEDYGIRLLTRR